MGGLEHLISTMVSQWYLTGGYLGIVLAMAIESCCVPLPSEIVMPLAGLYVAQYPERFSLLGVAVAGAMGCLAGSAAAYSIGYSGGRPLLLRYGRYVLISQADSDRADRLFARYGSAVTFFSRLLPVVRTYISLPAGIARMSFSRFCVYTLLGSLPWCLALAWVGTKLGERRQLLTAVFHGLDAVIGVALVAGIALYVWRHIRHDNVARSVHIGASQRAASRRRRPVPQPASHLDVPDRPTVPSMQQVPAWPNRYARPLQIGRAEETSDRPGGAHPRAAGVAAGRRSGRGAARRRRR
jgi:membrane protein DedA with SNARE-associated domain